MRAFNASDYDLVIFTGDLGSGTAKNGVTIARSVSRLTKPTLVMPGNNDVPFLPEIAAEFGHQRGLAAILDLEAEASRRHAQVRITGYQRHAYSIAGQEFTVVTGRPFAMGGSELSFPEALRRNYRIESLDESKARLGELIDAVDTNRLVILGHNGPAGLGGGPTDLWGRDFVPEHGDWGDADLAHAVSRAADRGLAVTVVAGHMHHRVEGGGQRRWFQRVGKIDYVNPARVPRISATTDRELRYHVALVIDDDAARLSEVEWSEC